jgi:hypothetical protein
MVESIQRVFRKKVCRHRSIWIMSSWRSPEQSRIVKDFYFPGWPLARFGLFLLWIIWPVHLLDKMGGGKKTQHMVVVTSVFIPPNSGKILASSGDAPQPQEEFLTPICQTLEWGLGCQVASSHKRIFIRFLFFRANFLLIFYSFDRTFS